MDSEGRIHLQKVLVKTNFLTHVPIILQNLFPMIKTEAFVIEQSIIDPNTASMTVLTANLTHKKFLQIQERMQICRISSQSVLLKSTATFQSKLSSRLPGLGSAIEALAATKFSEHQAQKSTKALIHVIKSFQR